MLLPDNIILCLEDDEHDAVSSGRTGSCGKRNCIVILILLLDFLKMALSTLKLSTSGFQVLALFDQLDLKIQSIVYQRIL